MKTMNLGFDARVVTNNGERYTESAVVNVQKFSHRRFIFIRHLLRVGDISLSNQVIKTRQELHVVVLKIGMLLMISLVLIFN